MNKDLLFQLYAIHSPSGSEKKMRKFIKRYVADNCGDCKVEQDEHGNLFITKGSSRTYPCLAAHIDQVQQNHSKDFKVMEVNGDVIAWSAKSHAQQGLGADDKNGVFICLEILKDAEVLKVAFFVGEEVGCKGSGACDLKFFSDCRFIIEPDRRGFDDLITSMSVGAVCSQAFVDAINRYNPGYKEARGTITDVGELVERGVGISCINISCGYYDAHTDHEYTVLSELELTLEFVGAIVENVTDSYPYKYEAPVYQSFGGYDYGYNYGYSYKGGYCSKGSKDDKKVTKNSYEQYWDYYDEDFDMMYNILCGQPYLTFEEVIGDWACNFFTKDMDLLRDFYEDAQAALGICDEDEDYWNGEHEDEEAGDVVYELPKETEEKPEEVVEEAKDEKSGLEVILNTFKGFCKKVS